MRSIKVGDWVRTKPGFKGGNSGRSTDMTYGGAGYKKNLRFKVGSIDNYSTRSVLWPASGGSGIYMDAATLDAVDIYEIY